MHRPIRKVADPPSLLQASGFLANFIISALVALTDQLEAAEKALSEEKAARLATDRSLTKAKAAQQLVDQARQTFEEAKAALAQDLLFTQASIIATVDKLVAKSSAMDFTVIWEREAELKLQNSGSRLLFVRCAARVKNIISILRDINREPLAFCMMCCTCKKYEIDVKGRQSGVSCYLYTVLYV
jgi:hypothetical protein